ncbi:recombinase family protein [Desulfotruncus alcoholivorax]|uniref:recombinase family protein n=1 Tax=Desulfotruncus alcoholivorax TaxID=265477 RepID=UPI000404D61F|nr:recombinase family protein [Desulfotruncus alcoholivorax]
MTAVADARMVAIYARLSVNENGERDESLETQCDLLKGYVLENGLGQFKLYVDNDLSGVYFDRPGLMKMTDDINAGCIKAVVIKDLSRLGRNNAETLTYINFLAEKNIRLIILTDNYDSFRDDDGILGIKTWYNEHYARDISKKVRYNLKKKMQNGEFLGRPPFGYQKSQVEKNKLVVDERYREIIRKIFDLYIKGWGYRALANYVQDQGVPTPSEEKGYINKPKSDRWDEQHIRRIITSRVYCGDSVQGVSEKVSFKSRKTRRKNQDKWIVVQDTHEAIITRDVWELAQKVRMKRWQEGGGPRQNMAGQPHLFTGFIVCAACGTCHVYRRKSYICGRYNRFGRSGCSSHYIQEKKLVDFIVNDIRHMAEGVSFHYQLIEEFKQNVANDENITAKTKKLEADLAGIKRQQQTLYLDKLKGIISEEMFLDTSAILKKEAGLLSDRLNKLQAQMSDLQRIKEDIGKINNMRLELDASDIDRAFLERYVKKIIVLEEGEKISAKVIEKFGLDLIFSQNQLVKMTGKVIILYNVMPVVQKQLSPGDSFSI